MQTPRASCLSSFQSCHSELPKAPGALDVGRPAGARDEHCSTDRRRRSTCKRGSSTSSRSAADASSHGRLPFPVNKPTMAFDLRQVGSHAHQSAAPMQSCPCPTCLQLHRHACGCHLAVQQSSPRAQHNALHWQTAHDLVLQCTASVMSCNME